MSSKIVYLIHTDKNSFDYLVLTNIGNEKAHEIYKRIYDKEFAEPTEYRRAGSFFDDDNQSKCSSHMDSSASDVSKGQTDGSGSDSESAISDDQRSPTPDDSHISDESGAARKRDGYTFDPECHPDVPRESMYGMFSFTNTVIDSNGLEYKTSQPVKYKGYSPGRFLYSCSLWATGSKSPTHIVYDPLHGTFHHVSPSWVTAMTDKERSAVLDNLPHDYKLKYENNLSTELEIIAKKKSKTMLRFPKMASKAEQSRKLANNSSTSDANTGSVEPPAPPAAAGRRSAGKGR
jgi:hypothetical protein